MLRQAVCSILINGDVIGILLTNQHLEFDRKMILESSWRCKQVNTGCKQTNRPGIQSFWNLFQRVSDRVETSWEIIRKWALFHFQRRRIPWSTKCQPGHRMLKFFVCRRENMLNHTIKWSTMEQLDSEQSESNVWYNHVTCKDHIARREFICYEKSTWHIFCHMTWWCSKPQADDMQIFSLKFVWECPKVEGSDYVSPLRHL